MTTLTRPSSHLVEAKEWAQANALGVNAVYEYMRRERNPLPHVRQGRRKLVDDELAIRWMRREFGVNTEEGS